MVPDDAPRVLFHHVAGLFAQIAAQVFVVVYLAEEAYSLRILLVGRR